MNVSAEISFYPLQEEYETLILELIARFKTHEGLLVRTNSMSTQLFGDWEVVMGALQQELGASFAQKPDSVAVIKLAGLDLR